MTRDYLTNISLRIILIWISTQIWTVLIGEDWLRRYKSVCNNVQIWTLFKTENTFVVQIKFSNQNQTLHAIFYWLSAYKIGTWPIHDMMLRKKFLVVKIKLCYFFQKILVYSPSLDTWINLKINRFICNVHILPKSLLKYTFLKPWERQVDDCEGWIVPQGSLWQPLRPKIEETSHYYLLVILESWHPSFIVPIIHIIWNTREAKFHVSLPIDPYTQTPFSQQG